MKVVQINVTCGDGSTGNICVAVSRLLTERGHENAVLYAKGNHAYPFGYRYMTPFEIKRQALRSKLCGNYGFNSRKATKRLLEQLDRLEPDVLQLHNLHGHNCDLEALFGYIRQHRIKTYWTFHDCWALTGYCPHFDMVGCDRWKTGCGDCVQKRQYSWLFDRSRTMLKRKRALFSDLDMTIITPSVWLKELVQSSFLGTYPVRVIPNGIDLSTFKPTESDFRAAHGLEGKYVLLGVGYRWDERKGLDVFTELARRLDERFRIVLVGTDNAVDKRLPDGVLSLHRTRDREELAKLYTAADLFVNPTREDSYPTVNMEALACGTPVLTFATGGSPEILGEGCGTTVPKNDIDALEREIVRICENAPYRQESCLARAKDFDMHRCFEEYVKLYEGGGA